MTFELITEKWATKQDHHNQAFFEGAGLTKPKAAIADDVYHNGGYELLALSNQILLITLPAKMDPLHVLFLTS